jgi:drug/metabolite transporter (DMT)-like permease
MGNTKTKGYILAVVSAVTYGAIPLFAIPIKRTGFSFDSALFYRFLIGAAVVGACLAVGRESFRVSLREFGALLLLGLSYALSAHFLFLGYDYMHAGVASTVLFIYPVFVALIMAVFFREKVSWTMWLAIAVAFLGVLTLNGTGDGEGFSLKGLVVVLLSALAYALYMVIVNKSAAGGMPGLKVSFYSMIFCSLFFFAGTFLHGGPESVAEPETALYIVLFSLIATVLSLVTLVYAVKLIGSTPTAVMGSLEPMTAVAISAGIFHEPLTGSLVAGMVLIVAAVVVTIFADPITRYFRKRKDGR